MVTWGEFAAAEPEFAARVQARFDAHRHKTMATLRRDGAPRISGTEVTFEDGEVSIGGGTASAKVRDLLRDPRVALHCAPLDTEMIEGDAKLSGRVRVVDPSTLAESPEELPENATFFRVDIDEVVLTRVVDAARLEVELWRPGEGLRVLIGA